MVTERYSSFDSGMGKDFEDGKLDMLLLAALAAENEGPVLKSGKQELFENLINRYI